MSLKWLTKQTIVHNEKLFQHCNLCNKHNCSYDNCKHGIKFLNHFNECKFKNLDCLICKSVLEVLIYHSNKCSKKNCNYPCCKFIKLIKYQDLKKNIDFIQKEIIIQQPVSNNYEITINNIKQNIKDIVEQCYPKSIVEII